MIEYLIDADCVVYAMAGEKPVLRSRLAACHPGIIAISAISLAEVALGTAQGKAPSPEALGTFLKHVPAMPFDRAAAETYAKMPFKRARFDRLLAAHALSIDATIITNNEADFADVPGLKVENWTK